MSTGESKEDVEQAVLQEEHIETSLSSLPEGIFKSKLLSTFREVRDTLHSQPTAFVLRHILEDGRLMHDHLPNSKSDALMASLHFLLIKRDFKSVGTEIDFNISQPSTSLPTAWNSVPGVYSIVYTHPKHAGKLFLVKALVMDNLLMVHVRVKDAKETHSLELDVDNYITESEEGRGICGYSYDVVALDSLLKTHLFPHLNVMDEETNPPLKKTDRPVQIPVAVPTPPPYTDPLRVPMRGDPHFRPDFEGDLIPGVGGGNLVGPDHPIFSGRYPGGLPSGHPPGARFDPYAPIPPRGPPGSGQGFFGPNPDELYPPGFGGEGNNRNFFL